MVTKPDRSTLNFLSTPSIGGTAKQKAPSDGVHRIRVDFKEDLDVEKVWDMGGLSILTSVPITPQVVCFLCASSGNVEVRKSQSLYSTVLVLVWLMRKKIHLPFAGLGYMLGLQTLCSLFRH